MSEPWSFAPDIEDGPSMDWNVFDAAGTLVCVACEEDARRIVACVNACAGIPTEQLEIEPYIGSVSYKMRMQAEKQRDELLAALKYAASVLDTDGHDPIIDAAIANAEARS